MINLNPLISIIVPVYNVFPYIGFCLKSLVAQSYDNIEIILVNDGSTDKSISVVEDYLEHDSRIILIDQDNLGLSSARNAGLEIASGEYVLFVDGDDWIGEDVCRRLVRFAVQNCTDVLVFGLRFNSSFSVREKVGYLTDNVLSGQEYLLNSFKNNGFSPSVCNKLFKKNSLETIKFPDNLKYEDIYFSIAVIIKAKKVMSIDNIFYEYRVGRCGSITSKLCIDNFYDLKIVYKKLIYFLEFNKFSEFTNNKYFISDILARIDNEIIIKIYDNTEIENIDEFITKIKLDSWFIERSKSYLLSNLSLVHKLNYFFFFNIKLFLPFARFLYFSRRFL